MATDNVREQRLRRGWTLDDLARRCGENGVPTAVSTIGRIERGVQAPRPRLRKLLAELLALDVTDFEKEAS
ncbi:MAG: helix-turn-helix domain-containing protein [Streptosporangiales bacterium]